jgi:hypothetical protein
MDACLSIAFMTGDWKLFDDRVIMDATRGPYVHTEVLLSIGDSVRAYASLGKSGFTVSPRKHSEQPGGNGGRGWRLVHFPLKEGMYKPVYALILQLLSLNLPYNSADMWQCCIKLLLPFERDLDCCNPVSWQTGGVFCSQVCLLLMRRLGRMGALSHPELVDWPALEATNSRGCSPNALYSLLGPPPKATNGSPNALYSLLRPALKAPNGSPKTRQPPLEATNGRATLYSLLRTVKKTTTNQGTRAPLALPAIHPTER